MSLKLPLYFLILLVMGMNGAWYLALFMSPPKAGIGLGIWYWLYFVIVPLLGILGIAALVLKKALNISWWVGSLLLLYVGSLTLPISSYLLGFAWILDLFFGGSFQVFQAIIFIATLIGLLGVMRRHEEA